MKLEKDTMVKIAGIAGTLLSLGATILTNYVKEDDMNRKIEKKVNDILEQKLKEMK